MKFSYTTPNPTLTEAELTAYEAGAGLRLPRQYRTFLLAQNGLLPDGMVAVGGEVDADLSEIFPLFLADRPAEGGVARPSGALIWFATDSGGGLFGIAHTGKAFGKVVWADLAHSEDEEPDPLDCTVVARSFQAFLDLLEPLDPA